MELRYKRAGRLDLADEAGFVIFVLTVTTVSPSPSSISRDIPDDDDRTLKLGDEQTVSAGITLSTDGTDLAGLDEGVPIEISAEATD